MLPAAVPGAAEKGSGRLAPATTVSASADLRLAAARLPNIMAARAPSTGTPAKSFISSRRPVDVMAAWAAASDSRAGAIRRREMKRSSPHNWPGGAIAITISATVSMMFLSTTR